MSSIDGLSVSRARRQHRLAVATLVLCTLLWSIAGIVIRRLDTAEGFEVSFWRSASCMLFLVIVSMVMHGRHWLSRIVASGTPGLLSGFMWAIMFTGFTLAISMTTVAKTLVLMAVSPLLAALLAHFWLQERIALRTWFAILLASIGIVLMVVDGLLNDGGQVGSHLGMLIAASVPIASAVNLIVLKKTQGKVDLLPAVLIGGLISALVMLPFAFPMQASGRDIAWLSMLGIVQVGIPCSLLVIVSRYLAPQETALLALLEVVFGPLWVWLGVGERPADATLWGGALVLAALVGNELWGNYTTRGRAGIPSQQAG